ncbi:putative aspartyl protease [Alicyclobacillus tengchongensis]|uniref:Aspartyl protease n=1 Tax=Alicyclobacillus tolerans TaxID=90970 RepID=A0ABT9LW92_9BACL|nr:putative aspartyl protease [Alicyclobacillus tengchongensis]
MKTNVAYRWFLGLKLTDRVPNHTTLSCNWSIRLAGTGIFQDNFDEIVLQGMKHRLISGRVLMTDSTHMKANANKHKFERKVVEEKVKGYLAEIDLAIAAERSAHQKKPLSPRKKTSKEREVKVSLTDADSGYM